MSASTSQQQPADDAVDVWEHSRVVSYVQRHGFSRVTLQFPDDLLAHAPTVAQKLQTRLQRAGSPAKVYVLADTSYNPLSIDEVAAAHVKADCVVHYGYASLHPVSRTPALCVLPQHQLDVQHSSTWLLQQLANLHDQVQQQQQQQQHKAVCVICCDQGYMHKLPQLQQAVLQAYSGPLQLVFAQSAATELWPQGSSPTAAAAGGSTSSSSCCGGSCAPAAAAAGSGPAAAADYSAAGSAADGDAAAEAQQPCSSQQPAPVPIGGLVWHMPGETSNSSNASCSGSSSTAPPAQFVWLGPPSSPALTHLQLSFASCPWLLLDPETQGVTEGLSPGLDRLLKRRYYLVEKARGAAMVGLLVGTLGAAGYKTALEQLKSLATQAGKKTYTLLMGKPNPAKLANFPELEVFVMLADPQGLILDSKEYLTPIITPHEAFLAFTGRHFDAAKYRLDFGDLLLVQEEEQQNEGSSAAATAQEQQDGAAAASSSRGIGGNINDSDADDDDDEEEDVQRLSAAAGALVIAGRGSTAAALTSNAGGREVQVQSAAQYLTQRRTYKGLETPATGATILPAAVAVQGRTGRAAGYEDEPQQ